MIDQLEYGDWMRTFKIIYRFKSTMVTGQEFGHLEKLKI